MLPVTTNLLKGIWYCIPSFFRIDQTQFIVGIIISSIWACKNISRWQWIQTILLYFSVELKTLEILELNAVRYLKSYQSNKAGMNIRTKHLKTWLIRPMLLDFLNNSIFCNWNILHEKRYEKSKTFCLSNFIGIAFFQWHFLMIEKVFIGQKIFSVFVSC